jgi:hypothetical protein
VYALASSGPNLFLFFILALGLFFVGEAFAACLGTAAFLLRREALVAWLLTDFKGEALDGCRGTAGFLSPEVLLRGARSGTGGCILERRITNRILRARLRFLARRRWHFTKN